ncbi:MAG: bifunctional 4-hydroxy-3-methylbut-2-enyl diphosphate reductase/30S ribosomal protein S1 [Clostridia bacterium]|nr:bifunctional 4-hydroxy-3-methylbut-2-enyl diphosphate reductase/30S ribosomal protein S1 [Clostridia bacterium]
MMKKIEIAENSGFCFGVKEAIKKTEEEIGKVKTGNLYTLGSLIHNSTVTDGLKAKGVNILKDLAELKKEDTVVIRSHGEAEKVYVKLREIGCTVVDATCPFVSKIHDLVRSAMEDGYHVVIVGDRNHPEVVGTNGWCNDSAIIVNSKEEAESVEEDNLYIVCQTTIIKKLLDDILSVFERKGKKFVVKNTICNATTVRQSSCENLAKKCDMMVIIGGSDSSNTKKLYDIAKKWCNNTFFVEKSEDFLLQASTKCSTIGVAAGASTPDVLIKEVIAKMSEKNVMSMEELLAEQGYDLDKAMKLPRLGEIVNGTVHQVTEKQVVVDMGCKKDGVIPKEEVTLEGEQKLTDLFKAGDEIQAKVIKIDDGDGVLTLSRKKLEINAHWDEIKKALENNEVLNVKVVRSVNGGVIGSYKDSVQGFIPLSQLSEKFVDNPEEYIGKDLDVRVIRIDDRKMRVTFSHKVIAAEEKQARIAEVWDKIDIGDIVEGKVMRFTDYGAFIDLGGLDGLLHISEISWGKLKHPKEVLQVGDVVRVKILSKNDENHKISLGLKQTTPEPWAVINEKYAVGQEVCGKVVQIKDYGAFVELEPGLDGLVHISEVAHKRVDNISDELKVGQEVTAKILEIDEEKKRISLSIKATLPVPEAAEEPAKEAVEE